MIKKLFCVISLLVSITELGASDQLYLPPPDIDKSELTQFSTWKSAYNEQVKTGTKEQYNNSSEKFIYINELILSQSPYLIQHSTNPINWKPWSNNILEKAKKENKLIFLSIGYSTCHWCHVMREESFTDVAVAKVLNAGFYSIKVDREELPHIDDYYMRALQQVKGEAGWPITAIVNGDGLPVFIDSYLPKQKLLKLLPRLNQIWQQQPEFLLSTAEKIDSLINQNLDNTAETISSEELLSSINNKLIKLLDKEHGGFTGSVKFPSEAMLLYSLDQLRRSPNSELENLLKLQLDKMITSGIYDHISGGFHRYTTDPSWLVPHFEKMLYNQAQLIIVYSLAYSYFKDPEYLKTVRQTTNFLLSDFLIDGKGFISAFDADFKGEEGGYYLWDKIELDILGISKGEYISYSVEGTNKVGLVLQSASQGTRDKLLTARTNRGDIYFDRKILTSWNALALKSLVYASNLLSDEVYLQTAIKLADNFWKQRFNDKTGHLARTSYSSAHTNQEQYLADYAYLADAFLAIYDTTGEPRWLERATKLSSYARSFFSNNEGAFSNVSNIAGGFASFKVSDSELISPAVTLNDVIFKLDKRLGTKINATTYSKQKNSLVGNTANQPMSHLYAALVLNNLLHGTQDSSRYFAAANGKVNLYCENSDQYGCSEFNLDITLKDGWHINSNKPLQDYLIATHLDVPEGYVVEYPDSQIVKLGFQPEPLSVYENNLTIRILRKIKTSKRLYLNLPLQACNDRICLLPETLSFLF